MPKIKRKPVTNVLFSLASNTIHPTTPLKPILNVFNCDHAEHKITRARKCLGFESTIVFHFENFTMNMAGDLASTPWMKTNISFGSPESQNWSDPEAAKVSATKHHHWIYYFCYHNAQSLQSWARVPTELGNVQTNLKKQSVHQRPYGTSFSRLHQLRKTSKGGWKGTW